MRVGSEGAAVLSLLAAAVSAVLVHEAGHLLAARVLGIPLRRGSGGLFGVRLTFDFSRAGYGREALVHLAGPTAGLLSSLAAVWLFGEAGLWFGGISAALAVFNLLPAGGLDGGGALGCLLWALVPPGSSFAPRVPRILKGADLAVRAALWMLSLRFALTGEPNVGLLLFGLGMAAGMA